MRRDRRFPIISTAAVVVLAVSFGSITFFDRNVPMDALAKIGQTAAGLGRSISLMLGGAADADGLFTFSSDENNGFLNQPAAMPVLVNADHPVQSGYAPQDLVRMREYCDDAIVTIKGSEIDGQRQAVDALMNMFIAAIEDGIGNWQISAGYRSVQYQQEVWDNKVYEYRKNNNMSTAQAESATAKYVAKPGCSEHHTGLAFDVTVPGESFPLTEQSKWLAENCWDYGFIIRYQEDKVEITGINAEPWHVRYVGQPHATIMRDNNWCLEEYLQEVEAGNI